MNNDRKRTALGCALLFLCAFFWGSTFVAQSSATGKIGTFSYLAARSVVGAAALWLLILFKTLILKKTFVWSPSDFSEGDSQKRNHRRLKAGIYCGAVITVASALQQYGMELGASSGEAGFITSVYMFIVPVLSFILYRKRISVNVFAGAVFAFLGLYFLCILGNGEQASFGKGQLLVLLCAFTFAVHITAVDRFTDVDGLWLSAIQFSVAAALSGAMALIFEQPSLSVFTDSWFEILYAGLFSTAIAYTLQIFGQKYAPATVASIVMSMESVVAFLTEWASAAIGIFGDRVEMNEWKIAGCALAFFGTVLAQLPPISFRKKK